MMIVSLVSSLILTDDTPIDDDGLFKMEHIFYSTHHYDRCRELCMKDPVHTDGLLDVLKKQVKHAPTRSSYSPNKIILYFWFSVVSNST